MGCAKRAVGTTLAITKPIDRMLSVVSSMAAAKLSGWAWISATEKRLPASTSRKRRRRREEQLHDARGLIRIVCGRSGVACRRLRMPPSR